MIKVIEGEKLAFVLETRNTTYAFRIMKTGHPEHLYYGRRVEAETMDDLEPLWEKRVFEPGNAINYDADNRAVVLEDACLEMSSTGHGDIREPFIMVVNADGSRTSDFLYKSHEISDKKNFESPMPRSYYSEDETEEQLLVTLEDKDNDQILELYYFVYPKCDCIVRASRFINNGPQPVELERLMSAQLDLSDSGWSVSSFHGAWAREMFRTVTPVHAGKFVVESRMGSSSSRANPFFMLHGPNTDEDIGDCYGFNLIYSGNHYEAVEVNSFHKTRVVTGINPQGFRWIVEPGGSFESPEAVMTFSPNGFTGQSRNMHRFVRHYVVRGVWKKKPRPILLNSWEACYFNINESTLLSLAKAGKELGIELFVVDDGWFGDRTDDTKALGDWEPDKKKLPGGLTRLADKVTALDMLFGVWVEPEMINVNSRLYEKHPEWVMRIPGKHHSEGRNQCILDLANPEVCGYIIDKLSEILSTAKISYVKWDYNRVFSDVYSPYLPKERQGETAHRYICGLYRIMKTLTEKFPEVLFEGCASGGNRFDLGILSYFPQIWASDNTDAISRAIIQEGYSYGYPMNTVSAHVSACPNHQTMRTVPIETRFNVAAFGVLGYELDVRDLSGEEKKKVRQQIELYKQWRELLQQGDFYRNRTGNIHEWTCVGYDGTHAVGMLLQELGHPNTQLEYFRGCGLDPDRKYLFYSYEQRVNVKMFGSLINTQTPIHVRANSLLHNVIAMVRKMPGDKEEMLVSGETLMRAGIKLKQGFSGTGYDEDVRLFHDFASRMYFMEAKESAGENAETEI